MKLLLGEKMSEYNVNVGRMFKKGKNGITRTEIWAEITDKNSCERLRKRIWWEDDNGVHHDETPSLPVYLRESVDNAWIEKSRKW